ncbi:MAG: hypothetical protein ACOX8T_10885 [Bacillota bacterium]|jgi:hypothetical protein
MIWTLPRILMLITIIIGLIVNLYPLFVILILINTDEDNNKVIKTLFNISLIIQILFPMIALICAFFILNEIPWSIVIVSALLSLIPSRPSPSIIKWICLGFLFYYIGNLWFRIYVVLTLIPMVFIMPALLGASKHNNKTIE